MSKQTYIDWIRAGLTKPGKSGKGLAGHLKRNPSVVTRILSGNREIKANELPRIADYLDSEIPVAGLAWDAKVNGTTTYRRASNLGPALSVRLVPVMAVIAPGVWREAGGDSVAAKARVPAVPDQRLAEIDQYACEIEGSPGSYVICVIYNEIRQRPLADDLVHVVRTKGDLREETLRRIAISGDHVTLHLPEPNAKGAPLGYPSRRVGELVEIKGLVVGRFQTTNF